MDVPAASSPMWVGAVVTLTLYVTGVAAAESCPNYTYIGGYLYYTGYKQCSNGCCGSYPNYYCCALSTAAVAGIVLGGIVFLCVSVFLCAYCMKKKTQKGRVIRPVQPTTTSTIVYTGMSGYHAGHAPPTGPVPQAMPAPPPYKRVEDAPPAYSNYGGYQPPGQYGYGQAAAWGVAGPSTAAHHPQTAASHGQPPATASAAPQQHSYGQGQQWSRHSSRGPPPTAQAPPPTAQAPPRTAASSVAPPPTASSAPPPSTAMSGDWQPPEANHRNTVTTRNLPSRLPPLPSDD